MKKVARIMTVIFLFLIVLACGISSVGAGQEGTQVADIQQTLDAIMREETAGETQESPSQTEGPDTEPKEDNPPSSPTATWRAAPCNRAELVDETIPDGTVMSPGQNFTKTWKIKNTGTCSWTQDYKVVFDFGHMMHGYTEENINEVIDPGDILIVTADLIANSAEGDYKGTYKLKAPDGTAFIKFWTDIKVESETPDSDDFDIEPIEPLPDDPIFRPLPQELYSDPEFFVDAAEKQGPCPLEFNFQFRFKVEGAGNIYYNFEKCNTQNNICEMVYSQDPYTINEENAIGTYTTLYYTFDVPFTGQYSLKIIVRGLEDKVYGPIEITAICN